MRKNEAIIEDPRTTPIQLFLSDGLQLGDVLERCLSFSGRSSITVATYSIGEEFLRRCSILRRKGLISNLKIVCDTKASEKTARLNPMSRKVADLVVFSQNHSKFLYIEGERTDILVFTSQNQTRGNRIENYTIIGHQYIPISLIEQIYEMSNQ